MQPEIDFAGVADEAANGGAPLLVCVCEDAEAARLGVESVRLQWQARHSALPVEAHLQALLATLDAGGPFYPMPEGALVLVPDAWRGDTDDEVVALWGRLNGRRDALRARLAERRASIILFVTEQVFTRIARSGGVNDLLGLAQVERADDESAAAEPHEADLIAEHQGVLSEMFTKYGLDTEEFVQRLLTRATDGIEDADLGRWSNAVSLLRKVNG